MASEGSTEVQTSHHQGKLSSKCLEVLCGGVAVAETHRTFESSTPRPTLTDVPTINQPERHQTGVLEGLSVEGPSALEASTNSLPSRQLDQVQHNLREQLIVEHVHSYHSTWIGSSQREVSNSGSHSPHAEDGSVSWASQQDDSKSSVTFQCTIEYPADALPSVPRAVSSQTDTFGRAEGEELRTRVLASASRVHQTHVALDHATHIVSSAVSTNPFSPNLQIYVRGLPPINLNFRLNILQANAVAGVYGGKSVLTSPLEGVAETASATSTAEAKLPPVVSAKSVVSSEAVPHDIHRGPADLERHEHGPRSSSATSSQSDVDHRENLQWAWLSWAVNTLKELAHKIFGTARPDHQPFTVDVEFESSGEHWISLKMLFDTGSNINLIHPHDIRNLGHQHKIEPLKDDEMPCTSFSGHSVALTGRVSLQWKSKLGKKYRTEFYLVEADNDAVTDVVLGSWSLTQYRLVRICAFGSKSKRTITPKPAKSKP